MSTKPQTDSDPTVPELDVPTLADCIDNERRREVIRLVGDCPVGSGYRLRELSRAVAAIENDKPEIRVTSKERKRVYVALYQCHVDALADAGILRVPEGDDVLICTQATKTALQALEALDLVLGGESA